MEVIEIDELCSAEEIGVPVQPRKNSVGLGKYSVNQAGKLNQNS